MCKLDIIIPVFNEGESILSVLKCLQREVKTPFRVLICYDYEEDNTLRALRAYEYSPFEIRLVKNRGEGVHGAVMTGFRASTASAVVVYPADDDYNAGTLDRMYQKLQEGCEIVAASRFMPGGCMVGCRWQKAILVRLVAFSLYHLAGIPTHDASNGFRLFSRHLLDIIEIESESGFTYSLELLVKCHRLGWKIGEVPARWFERTKGTSRFRILKWAPAYLRWYFYAFATTWLRCGPARVRLRGTNHP